MASLVYVCESCGNVYGEEPARCACGSAGETMREETVRSADERCRYCGASLELCECRDEKRGGTDA